MKIRNTFPAGETAENVFFNGDIVHRIIYHGQITPETMSGVIVYARDMTECVSNTAFEAVMSAQFSLVEPFNITSQLFCNEYDKLQLVESQKSEVYLDNKNVNYPINLKTELI